MPDVVWWIVELLMIGTLAMGWWPCCCGPPVNYVLCACCDDYSGNPTGQVPDPVYVTVSGMTNSTCTQCSNYNGTWTLAKSFLGSNHCQWQVSVSNIKIFALGSCQNATTAGIVFHMWCTGTSPHVTNGITVVLDSTYSIGPASNSHYYNYSITWTSFDCRSFSVSPTYSSSTPAGSINCTGSSPTITAFAP